MIDIIDWKRKGEFFTYEGHNIFYLNEGQGETLLLIHGFPTSSWDWCKVWESLTKAYQVIAIDMIGFGYSDKPQDYVYSMFDQSNLIESLLSQIEVKGVHILAHDYGDTVAQELLHKHNHKELTFNINSCVLLNGGLFHGVHKPRLVQKLLLTPFGPLIQKFYTKDKFAKTFHNIFGKNSPPTTVEIESFWELMNHNGGRKIFNKLIRYLVERKEYQERWLKALQNFEAPLRLIDGVADPISGQHLVDHYVSVIPNADVIELDNIGHYPQTEAWEDVLKHYDDFRKRIST